MQSSQINHLIHDERDRSEAPGIGRVASLDLLLQVNSPWDQSDNLLHEERYILGL